MSLLFSKVTATRESDKESRTFLARGIPKSYDDLELYTAMDYLLDGVDEDTTITIETESYTHGEGSSYVASYEELAYTAINNRQKILFLYFDYDKNHNRVYRHDGHHYVVSPYATIFADGHYYLVIYDSRHKKMVHYRIDRMDQVDLLDELAEMPPDELAFDVATHKKQLFGMFSGEATTVTIEMKKYLMDVVFDLFGEKTKIVSVGEDWIRFSADVQISDLFFGWCCSFGENLKLIAPQNILNDFLVYADRIKKQYN